MNLELPAMMAPVRGKRRDYRMLAIALTIAGTALLGYVVSMVPGRGVTAPVKSAPAKRVDLSELPAPAANAGNVESVPQAPLADARKAPDAETGETQRVLNEADTKIRAKRFDEAIAVLHAARERIQHEPKSYIAMARALEGKKDYAMARDFYEAAIDRDVTLADAYFGFATASEALGDLEAAIGGMRSFLHVQPNADPAKLKIAQARSAIWEWESLLGRGAWGPTKGVPPGFTADELKRDGRGVGIKIPIPGTEQPDGRMKYEIKHQDKFQIFKP